MKEKINYEEYLDEDQCTLIRIMGVQTVMRDLCEYYVNLIPFVKRALVYAYLTDAYKKILRSHEKFIGGTR